MVYMSYIYIYNGIYVIYIYIYTHTMVYMSYIYNGIYVIYYIYTIVYKINVVLLTDI